MHSHFISKLLGLEDVSVTKVIHSKTWVKIFLDTKPSPQECPSCHAVTSRIHDYRHQAIKDLPLQNKNCILVLHKRRYLCPSCGKRFYEHYSFAPRYLHRTARLTAYIAGSFLNTVNIKDIAARSGVSSSTVVRILDTIHFPAPASMPLVFSIDEFKGNAEGRKYQVIITDPKKHRVLDILPDRSEVNLTTYLRSIPPIERKKVKYFVSDMYMPYIRLARQFFPNATVVVDKYHFIRQVGWAIEGVRKRLQKTMPADLRKYYKRSHTLILTRYKKLTDERKEQCDLMLRYSNDLYRAHWLKEWFYEICQNKKYSEQRVQFWKWIDAAERSGLKEFSECAKTYRNWCHEILAAFKHPDVTNGITEGFNNRIKVLKRTSYGIRSFERFRSRILMAMN